MGTFKIFDGTNWVDPCDCNVHLLDSSSSWVLLDPKNCPTKYWNGCEWVLIVCPCNCAEGYVFNEGTGMCEKAVLLPAVFTGATSAIVAGDKISAYGSTGGFLYPSLDLFTWPIRGYQAPSDSFKLKDTTGIGTTLPATSISVNSIFKSVNAATGRLNIAGIWANPWPDNVPGPNAGWLSFNFCITIAEEKQYVLGIAGDNHTKIEIDSPSFGGLVEVITIYSATDAAGTNHDPSVTEPFNRWFLLPITLPVGTHTIILSGYDEFGNETVAAEIYDRTEIEILDLMAMGQTIADLEPHILFSTKNLLLPLPDGPLLIAAPGAVGVWSCPDPETTFSECYGVPACVLIDSIPCE